MKLSPLKYLFEKQAEKTITAEEATALRDFIAATENETVMNELIKQLYYEDGEEIKMNEENAGEILHTILETGRQPAKVIAAPFKKRLYQFTVAAAIMFVIAIGAWLVWQTKSTISSPPVARLSPKNITPGKQGAILTLSNGKQIVLDAAANGTLAKEGDKNIVKKNGELAYMNEGNTVAEVVYNTMTTPKGRTFQLTLSDGSKIWLNAASSIHYPVAFTGTERRVEITGEVYFEVSHNAAMPFKVTANGTEVEVLGTHFNMNAYSDEPVMKTTLLEGKVQVKKNTATAVLRPGQQAITRQAKDDISVASDVDIAQVIAWQKGIFEFNKTDLPTIMRQVSRWYDVDIAYEGNVTHAKYGGGISRNLPLSEILDLLEANGVKFRLEGKKLIVIP